MNTSYKNINFRSGLEAKFAYFLDNLYIKWEYEKYQILVNNIIYKPDFYLPKQNLFIELKGVNYDLKRFSKEEWRAILNEIIIRQKKQFWIFVFDEKRSLWFDNGFHFSENKIRTFMDFSELWKDNNLYSWMSGEVYLFHCSNCLEYFFAPSEGNYSCPSCSYHNGDDDCKGIIFHDIFFSIDTVKNYLKNPTYFATDIGVITKKGKIYFY